MSETDRESIEVLAGEYVLGLLEPGEAAVVERQIETDTTLADAVQRWRNDLAPLAMTTQPIKVGEETWDRISASLRALAPVQPLERAPRSRTSRRRGRPLWSSLTFWRLTTLAGAAAAAILAVVALQAPSSTPTSDRTPVAMTVMQSDERPTRWVVQAFSDNSVEVTALQPAEVPVDRVLQFWTLRDAAEGPRSLGIVPPTGTHRVDLGDLPPPIEGQLFEITEEPAGGSPTDRPTGAVLAMGNITLVPR